jgi:hypothetical protein
MIFGIISSNNCQLTQIGRALKEDISLKKTAGRLGRNLAKFTQEERDILMRNYLAAVRPAFKDNTILIIDGGDATKPCSPKMENIGTVFDGSRRQYAQGYWTIVFSLDFYYRFYEDFCSIIGF